LVIADPTPDPSTVKLTVAPVTAAPPVVRVRVAVKATGPVEPNGTEAGFGTASDRDVATVAEFTTIPDWVPVIVDVPVSVAVSDWMPAVLNVALNVATPLSLLFSPVVNV